MRKPLQGIKVLDLTRVLAGPYCTMLLHDLGAEVIKLEIPGKGDDSRSFGPFINEQSLYFLSINRGKKSVSLNLKAEKGKEILRELIKKADVLVENYRPGTMEKLGLGYEELKTINPKLIYAAASGFGHSGPYSKRPAYDILAQAIGGIMSITGWPDTPPTRVGMSLGDINAALFTTIGILSAIYNREKTGLGDKVDVSMLDCQLAILENALVRYQVDGKSPEPLGNRHPTISPFQAYQAKDGNLVLAIGNDSLWKNFCKAIKRDDLLENTDFQTNPLRTKNLEKLNDSLNEIFKEKTVDEWCTLLAENDVPHGPINNIEQVMEHPQILARNMIVPVEDSVAGKVKIAGNPIKMNSIPELEKHPEAPGVGENTLSILGEWLEYSEEDVEKLFQDGVC